MADKPIRSRRSMVSSASFQTRARTVDHLGREQIADCPTAISELWKNSYDAYARNVQLDIIDRAEPVAVLSDDGHGMSRREFDERWLVIGTESKLDDTSSVPRVDRNGLPPRPRQGQKGIGRLSCANLGPLLLLLSKRKSEDAVAALIDWRLFENPFINLSDIEIPVVNLEKPQDIFDQIEVLHNLLVTNVTGDGRSEEAKQVLEGAWAAYDKNHAQEHKGVETNFTAPSLAIQSLAASSPFEAADLDVWKNFGGKHGTVLMVAGLNYDLRAQLAHPPFDASEKATRDRFNQTLSSFIDPYIVEDDRAKSKPTAPDFRYAVAVHRGGREEMVLGTDKNFNRRQVEGMEHCIEGTVNDDGVFVGRIKSFGTWLPDAVTIEPPKNAKIPDRANTKIGPFRFYISAMEWDAINSTHTAQEHQHYKALAEQFAGFMIYRDGLRVLPYGRADNDFFEIESRRSRSAGREFWNHRQMFGRIAISRSSNPNLKDKAGREGLLDNVAAKAFKSIVDNILMVSARRFFGSSSDIRKTQLPDIKASNKAARAREARQQLQKRQRAEFAKLLEAHLASIPGILEDLLAATDSLSIGNDDEMLAVKESLHHFEIKLVELAIPDVPKALGSLKGDYERYREEFASLSDAVSAYRAAFEAAVASFEPTNPSKAVEDYAVQIKKSIRLQLQDFSSRVEGIQKREFERMRQLRAEREDLLNQEIADEIQFFRSNLQDYTTTFSKLETILGKARQENRSFFEPYVRSLEALSESIDLETLAASGMEELSDARKEIERLNALAQLGIAVEISGHDLEDYDSIITSALAGFPESMKELKAYQDLQTGVEGLTDHLRFLSPLRLAGQRVEREISGAEISQYIRNFFAPVLARTGIRLTTDPRFEGMILLDRPSRIMPVFINLVNNSIYWTALNRKDGEISIHTDGTSVIVADNGPGVADEDIENLFSLFFTRKARGGRGVGLYLARANLTAGGHSIRYKEAEDNVELDGAAFVIEFTGAEFSDE
ncbi:ATP-binding protein [Parasphingopyxis marina]|uniref:ATP-binding protein n=1 Tax=Parasphingopyxis marina TaxID=2761622 RepID=A0A842HW46_9SPHN|nr:ATP-binding protein [Parasphingopyxis marina]MBC2777125.1 ATP-binding protein [Parasphingopyxis marina]